MLWLCAMMRWNRFILVFCIFGAAARAHAVTGRFRPKYASSPRPTAGGGATAAVEASASAIDAADNRTGDGIEYAVGCEVSFCISLYLVSTTDNNI